MICFIAVDHIHHNLQEEKLNRLGQKNNHVHKNYKCFRLMAHISNFEIELFKSITYNFTPFVAFKVIL